MNKQREEWIDFAKGIAILLVVIGHVNSGLRESGVFSNYKGFLNYIDFTIYSFHMPLFFAISGYLYSKTTRINSIYEYKHDTFKKIISLGIPYLVFSLLYCSIKLLFSKYVNKSIDMNVIMKIPFKPIEFLWFLYALLGIFLLVLTLDFVSKNKYLNLVILTLLFISTYFFKTSIVILDYAFKYSFYFYLGKFIQEKNGILKNNKIFIISIVLSMVTNVLLYSNLMDIDILKVVFAISSSYVIFVISNKMEKNDVINFLGKSTLQIYLMHVIICSATRVMLLKLGIINIFVNYVLGISFGVIIPLIAYSIISKFKILDFCLFPTKYLNIKKKYNANLELSK